MQQQRSKGKDAFYEVLFIAILFGLGYLAYCVLKNFQ